MCDLYLAVPSAELRAVYEAAAAKYNATPIWERDSGFDVYCDQEYYLTYGSDTTFLKFGILAACATKSGLPRGYWLMPRSSISKTPFVCANSMGLIDAGYRGQLMGAVRMVQDTSAMYTIAAKTRLFQIVAGSAKPWTSIVIVGSVEELPNPTSLRGAGGFGSTGQ